MLRNYRWLLFTENPPKRVMVVMDTSSAMDSALVHWMMFIQFKRYGSFAFNSLAVSPNTLFITRQTCWMNPENAMPRTVLAFMNRHFTALSTSPFGVHLSNAGILHIQFTEDTNWNTRCNSSSAGLFYLTSLLPNHCMFERPESTISHSMCWYVNGLTDRSPYVQLDTSVLISCLNRQLQ